MADLLPYPLPAGGVGYAQEITDAVVAIIEANAEVLGVTKVEEYYPQPDEAPRRVPKDSTPLVEVWTETRGIEWAAAATQEMIYETFYRVITVDNDTQAARATLENIRQNIRAIFGSAWYHGTTQLLGTHASWIEGFSMGDVSGPAKRNPHVRWASNSMTVRVVQEEPAQA